MTNIKRASTGTVAALAVIVAILFATFMVAPIARAADGDTVPVEAPAPAPSVETPVHGITTSCGFFSVNNYTVWGKVYAGCSHTGGTFNKIVRAQSHCRRPNGTTYYLYGPWVAGFTGNASSVGCWGNLGHILLPNGAGAQIQNWPTTAV